MSKRQPVWPLVPILGKLPFWSFLIVTLFVVSFLGAINIVSKYVIKGYVDDQLTNINWDQVVYQFFDLTTHERISKEIERVENVEVVETLGWLRLKLTGETLTEFSEGRRVFIPWVTIVSASDPAVLPPALRDERTLAVIGSQRRLQSATGQLAASGTIQIVYRPQEQERSGASVRLLGASFNRVVQLDRKDVIQWIMREVGGSTLVPDEGLIVVLPFADFSREVGRISEAVKRIDDLGDDDADAEESGMRVSFAPEISHLMRFNRAELVTGWDLRESVGNVGTMVERVHRLAEQHSFRTITNSDLLISLDKLSRSERLVSIVSVLLSSPILLMLWICAGSLGSLVVLNSKRTMGLLRLRGVSGRALQSTTLIAIGAGGLVGGVIGGLLGTFIPVLGYQFNGVPAPWERLTRIQEPWLLFGFVVVGTLFAMASGKKVSDYCIEVTPHDAAARVSASEAETFAFRWSWLHFQALLLGTYKIVAWVVDYTPPAPLLWLDRLLDYLGAPLFIYGVTTLLVSRSRVVRALFAVLAAPVAGILREFVVSNMMMRRHRITSAILITALMFAITLYPRVTADSFYDKVFRGVQVNTGADLAVILDSSELLGEELKIAGVGEHFDKLERAASALQKVINSVPGVRTSSPLYEMLIPGQFYIPGASNQMPLNILGGTDSYLRTAHHEDRLGVGDRFRSVISGAGGGVVISKGLAEFEEMTKGEPIVLGMGQSGEVSQDVTGVLALFPGAPKVMPQDRESYVGAEIDYINLLGRTSPFMVAYGANGQVRQVKAIAARTVILVDRTDDDAAHDEGKWKRDVEAAVQSAGIKPLEIKSVGDEEDRVAKDMFVSLGLANMRIYLIGGIAVALAGVLAISLANFWQMRWTLGLMRVRGAAPKHLLRVIMADFVVPLAFGLVIGVLVGVATGYGLANQMFKVPRFLGALGVLPVHLTLTGGTFVSALILGVFFCGTAMMFSLFVFRRTARENLRE